MYDCTVSVKKLRIVVVVIPQAIRLYRVGEAGPFGTQEDAGSFAPSGRSAKYVVWRLQPRSPEAIYEEQEEAMSTLETLYNEETRLAGPVPRRGAVSVFGFLRAVRNNNIAVWPEQAYRSDVLRLRILLRDVIVVNSPQLIKHILLDRVENYRKSPIQRRVLGPLLGESLLMSEGELWRRHRRIIAPIFRPQRIEQFTETMAAAVQEMLQEWSRVPRGEAVDVAGAMSALALTIITRAMFSSEPDSDMAAIVSTIPEYQRSVRPHLFDLLGLPQWVPRLDFSDRSARVDATCGILNATLNRIIEERRSKPNASDDLLSLLLNARDEAGAALDAGEIRDEVANFLLAGYDTSAHALTWTWYLLSLHPAEEKKLHDELRAVLGDRPPNGADLPRLHRARMILEESMRLYPPAHTLSRLVVADDDAYGHHLPKGATIIISPWLLHRNENLWDKPEVFRPDRFQQDEAAARHRFAYIPFGGGPRICIGAPFALAEGVLALATIAQRFRLRLAPTANVEPVALITLKPKYGLQMQLEPRI